MNQIDLEQVLRDFGKVAHRLRGDKTRSIWAFSNANQQFILHHFPRRGPLRLNPALQRFVRLTALQKLGIAAPRAIAQLAGFTLEGRVGDAVIVEALADAVPLDWLLLDARARCIVVPHRWSISMQVADIIGKLGAARWRPTGLTLSSFLVSGGRVYLHDVEGLRRGAMRLADVWPFAHDAGRFATRTEMLRTWQTLEPGGLLPRKNPVSISRWRRTTRQATDARAFTKSFSCGQWSGSFTSSDHFARPWSLASRLSIGEEDWQAAWPILLGQMQRNQLSRIKKDASGEVFGGEVLLAGRSIRVMVKRPFRKRWYRYLTDAFRGAKPARVWRKAWQLLSRNIGCEFPLLLMERRRCGYPVDGIVVFENVPGISLDQFDLGSLTEQQRELLFRRAGKTTRAVELGGLAHYDAKSTNWIVFQSDVCAPTPVMIDLDGIRPLNRGLVASGVRRLLRAMLQHPQYTPADSLALCRGYAPFSQNEIQEAQATI